MASSETGKLLSADPKAGVLLSTDPKAGITPKTEPSKAPIVGVTAAAVPAARMAAEELATNPNAWKAGKVIGEIIGAGAGLLKGDPLSVAGGMWVGGKAGWRLTNAAQRLSVPLYKALKAAEPFATPLSAISAEGGTLEALNTPENVAKLARQMNPPSRQRLLDHYKDQPEFVSAIKRVTGMK